MQQLEAALRERDEKLTTLLLNRAALDEELLRLRAEVAQAKKEAAADSEETPDAGEA